jgi:hypothetical protein
VVVPQPARNSSVEYLALRGLGGSAARRVALVHSGIKTYTLAVGDSVIMQTPLGDVDMRCVEIRDNSVVVKIASESEPRELRLR